MVKTYSAITVKKIINGLSAVYKRELRALQAQIDSLSAENRSLKERLFSETGELDMEQILRPDPTLRLDNLCRELGVMDNEE